MATGEGKAAKPDGPVTDTNVSRRAHPRAVSFDLIEWAGCLYQAWRYSCPRCGWQSTPKRARAGGDFAARTHQATCPALGPAVSGESPRTRCKPV